MSFLPFAEDKIFVADPEFIFQIIARFVGGDHSFLKHRCRISRKVFPTEAVRSFVNIQKIAYPVSCAVVIIFTQFPDRSSGKIIEV